MNTKTYVLNLDTLYKLKALNFLDKDLNSTVKLSHQMAQDCVDIARDMGYTFHISRMSFGGGSTDAAAFGEAGIEATNLCAMSFDGQGLRPGLGLPHAQRCQQAHRAGGRGSLAEGYPGVHPEERFRRVDYYDPARV